MTLQIIGYSGFDSYEECYEYFVLSQKYTKRQKSPNHHIHQTARCDAALTRQVWVGGW